MPKRKVPVKQTVTSDKAQQRRLLIWSIVLPAIAVLLIYGWQHRAGIAYLWGKWFEKEKVQRLGQGKFDLRNIELMRRHDDKLFGIDISQYQMDISWDEVLTINHEFPIDFIFIRATMGEQDQDRTFKKNWKAVKKKNK